MSYAPETYYVHKYGGIYKTLCLSTSAIDQSLWVIYRHVYPFEELVCHRPLEQWTSDRFVEIDEASMFAFIHNKSREELKAEIAVKKAAT